MNKRLNGRIDRLVRQRWIIEERLITLQAAVRQLLRDHAFERMAVIGGQLRAAMKIKRELEKQLGESHCTVQSVYPL